jgi:DHA1 family inner membrane transport protein
MGMGLSNLPLMGVGVLALTLLVCLPLPRLRATRERLRESGQIH